MTSWRLIEGDCIEAMAALPAESVDAVCTDPPYGLGFMGHEWDQPGEHGPVRAGGGGPRGHTSNFARRRPKPMAPRPGRSAPASAGAMHAGRYDLSLTANERFQDWCRSWASEAFRVLKPGGALLVFGGTRTYHRMAAGVEDAGFEIRDSILSISRGGDAAELSSGLLAWMYGSGRPGFPKSMNLDNVAGFCRCTAVPHAHGIRSQDVHGVRAGMGADDPVPSRAEQDLQPGVCRTSGECCEGRQADRSPSEVGDADLRGVRDHVRADASVGEAEDGGADLLAAMQRSEAGPRVGEARPQGANCQDTRELPAGSGEDARRAQPGLEGRGDDPLARQSRGGEVCPVPGVGAADGEGGRLCHGAPSPDGDDGGVPAHTDRSGASPEPRPAGQPPGEPRALAGQPVAQARGAWPLCGGCGLPHIPRGLGTALKPAFEPIVVARKPLVGTVARNVLAHGTGALNIDGCRIEGEPDAPGLTPAAGGRWPANVILDEQAAAALDEQTGELVSGREPAGGHRRNSDKFQSVYGAYAGTEREQGVLYGDRGGASRFFYCAKTSSTEREAGLAGLPARVISVWGGDEDDLSEGKKATRPRANVHPTVKPIELMRWLVRLVTPPGGLVLDPFTGSGSTGCAAVREGVRFVGIERERDYLAIARARIAWWAQQPEGIRVDDALAGERVRQRVAETGQVSLLEGLEDAA